MYTELKSGLLQGAQWLGGWSGHPMYQASSLPQQPWFRFWHAAFCCMSSSLSPPFTLETALSDKGKNAPKNLFKK